MTYTIFSVIKTYNGVSQTRPKTQQSGEQKQNKARDFHSRVDVLPIIRLRHWELNPGFRREGPGFQPLYFEQSMPLLTVNLLFRPIFRRHPSFIKLQSLPHQPRNLHTGHHRSTNLPFLIVSCTCVSQIFRHPPRPTTHHATHHTMTAVHHRPISQGDLLPSASDRGAL